MAFTFVQNNGATQDASGGSISVALTGITAGNLIVVWLKHEGAATTYTFSDGTSTLTNATITDHSNSDLHALFGYLLSANSGNKTFTCTFGAARTFSRIHVWEISNLGQTIALDAQNTGSGTSQNPLSGNITTASNDEIVFGGYGEYSAETATGFTINGVAADGSRTDVQFSSWYKIETSTFSNGAAAQSAFGASRAWIENIISFQVSAGGGTPLLGQACL